MIKRCRSSDSFREKIRYRADPCYSCEVAVHDKPEVQREDLFRRKQTNQFVFQVCYPARQHRYANARFASVLMNAARIRCEYDFCFWRMLSKPWSAAQACPFLGPGDHFDLRKASEARLEIVRFDVAP